MKRSCFGCKALDKNGDNTYYCSLHYQNANIYNIKTGTVREVKPLEECPKPTSTKKLFDLLIKKTYQS